MMSTITKQCVLFKRSKHAMMDGLCPWQHFFSFAKLCSEDVFSTICCIRNCLFPIHLKCFVLSGLLKKKKHWFILLKSLKLKSSFFSHVEFQNKGSTQHIFTGKCTYDWASSRSELKLLEKVSSEDVGSAVNVQCRLQLLKNNVKPDHFTQMKERKVAGTGGNRSQIKLCHVMETQLTIWYAL